MNNQRTNPPKGARGSKPRSDENGKNAARERTRVRSLRMAFQRLQSSLPTVPPDTKLSKLDVLILATNYISHLSSILSEHNQIVESDVNESSENNSGLKILHPIKKWPMRSRLYAGAEPIVSSSNGSSEAGNSRETMTSPTDSFILEAVEPLSSEEWGLVDLDLFYDDLTSLSSFPTLPEPYSE